MHIVRCPVVLFTFILYHVIHAVPQNRTIRQAAKCTPPEFFRCNNRECISGFSVCDGAVDCSDGSDETQGVCNNLSVPCPAYGFRCAYGACVQKDAKCNGKKDCADNSDEALPECQKNSVLNNNSKCNTTSEFECTSGECIDGFSVCDGVKDCKDGSDETITQCVIVKCPAYSFQCSYGGCIDKSKKCNKVIDCVDGSDEAEDLCKTKKPPLPKPATTPKPVTGSDDICMLPNKPDGGTYRVISCRQKDIRFNNQCQGVPVESYTVIEFSCHKNYLMKGSKNVLCINGNWNEFPTCQKLCKPILSRSLNLECVYNGQYVPCNRPLYPDTKVTASCKHSYKLLIESGVPIATCLSNGELNENLIQCIPECGIENPEVTVLINDGTPAKHGEFPWHVGLYYAANKKQICGGTLISPNAVLTAAHCIYDENKSQMVNATYFLVAAGKYKRSLEPEEPYQQVLEVRDIVLKLGYRGSNTNYEQDIAILDVKTHFNLSSHVLPACLDVSPEAVRKGTKGTVAGWGQTEKKKPSEELLVAKLPILDYDTCRKDLPANFVRFITSEKFCAGYMSGPGVQQGDSGGGLTVQQNNKHYVYGVVSLKPKDLDTSYALFTNVTSNLYWIQKTLAAFRSFHVS